MYPGHNYRKIRKGGGVVIPAAMRAAAGITQNDWMGFEISPNGVITMRKEDPSALQAKGLIEDTDLLRLYLSRLPQAELRELTIKLSKTLA